MCKVERKVRCRRSVFSNMNEQGHLTNKHSPQQKLMFGGLSGGDQGSSSEEKSKKEQLGGLSSAGASSSSFKMVGCNAGEESPHSSTHISRPNAFGDDFPRKQRSATKKRGRELMLDDSENKDGEGSPENDSSEDSDESKERRMKYDLSGKKDGEGSTENDSSEDSDVSKDRRMEYDWSEEKDGEGSTENDSSEDSDESKERRMEYYWSKKKDGEGSDENDSSEDSDVSKERRMEYDWSKKKDGEGSDENDSSEDSDVSKERRMDYDWTKLEVVSGPITREEREVVETLYAMSRVTSDNDSFNSSEEYLPDNSPDCILLASATAQGATTHCDESSAREASNMNCLNEAAVEEQPNVPESSNPVLPFSSSVPTLKTVPEVVDCENYKVEVIDCEHYEVEVIDCENYEVAPHDSGLNLEIGEPRSSQVEKKPDAALVINERKRSEGLTLWPDLSTEAPAGQASASKLKAIETSATSSGVKQFVPKKPYKRSLTHVHICHVIKDLKMSRNQAIKETELKESNQMRAQEGSKRVVHSNVQGLNLNKNGATSSTVRKPPERKNNTRHPQRRARYTSHAAASASTSQNYNLFRFPAASTGLQVENNYNRTSGRLAPFPRFQAPYLPALPYPYGAMPIPAAQNQYPTTTSYLNQFSVSGPQVPVQQRPYYFGNPLYGTNYSSTEHQIFQGVQHAEQGRSTANWNNMRTQYPNWQSERPSALQELFGSNITSTSDRQRQVLNLFPDERIGPSSSSSVQRN